MDFPRQTSTAPRSFRASQPCVVGGESLPPSQDLRTRVAPSLTTPRALAPQGLCTGYTKCWKSVSSNLNFFLHLFSPSRVVAPFRKPQPLVPSSAGQGGASQNKNKMQPNGNAVTKRNLAHDVEWRRRNISSRIIKSWSSLLSLSLSFLNHHHHSHTSKHHVRITLQHRLEASRSEEPQP